MISLVHDAANPDRAIVICGCVFKDMTLKPSILDTYSGAGARVALRVAARRSRTHPALPPTPR